MERLNVETFQALQAHGFHPGERVQTDIFGLPYLSGPVGDWPLPTYAEAADWMETTKGVIITRVFPERYQGGKWVAAKIIRLPKGKADGCEMTFNHVPANLDEMYKKLFLEIIKIIKQ